MTRLSLASIVTLVCVLLFLGGQTGFSQCTPPPHNNVGDISIYNPAFSSKCNWNDPNRGPDQTITLAWGNGTHSATTSVALAGAIVSFKLGGKEYISSGGHGSALNWAFIPQSLDAGTYGGECYNPTLSGTAGDDSQAGWNWAPFHGPSTSAILQPLSWAPPGQLLTVSRMAFYIPQGASGFGCGPAWYPNRSPYNVTFNGNLSPFIFRQTGTFGYPIYNGFVDNVLNVKGDLTVEENHGPNFTLANIVYMQLDFGTFYKYNPATDVATIVKASQYVIPPYPSVAGNSATPIIVATPGGAYAMGMIVDMSARESAGLETHYYYLGYNNANQYYPHTLRTMQVTYQNTPSAPALGAGTVLSYNVHYVFGDLNWVKWGIRQLYWNNKQIDPSSIGY